jgi:hypothetical protein
VRSHVFEELWCAMQRDRLGLNYSTNIFWKVLFSYSQECYVNLDYGSKKRTGAKILPYPRSLSHRLTDSGWETLGSELLTLSPWNACFETNCALMLLHTGDGICILQC